MCLRPSVEKLKERKAVVKLAKKYNPKNEHDSQNEHWKDIKDAIFELLGDDSVDIGQRVRATEILKEKHLLQTDCNKWRANCEALKEYDADVPITNLIGETVLSCDTQKYTRDLVKAYDQAGLQSPTTKDIETYKTFFDYWRKTREERTEYNKYFITLLFVQVFVAVVTALVTKAQDFKFTDPAGNDISWMLVVFIFATALFVSIMWFIKLGNLWELEKTQRFVLAKMEQRGFAPFPAVTLWMQKVNEDYSTKKQLINLKLYRDNINYYGLPIIMMSLFAASILALWRPSLSFSVNLSPPIYIFLLSIAIPLVLLGFLSRIKTTKPDLTLQVPLPPRITTAKIKTEVVSQNFVSGEVLDPTIAKTWSFNVMTIQAAPHVLCGVPLKITIDGERVGTLSLKTGQFCLPTSYELSAQEITDIQKAEKSKNITEHQLGVHYDGDGTYESSDFMVQGKPGAFTIK